MLLKIIKEKKGYTLIEVLLTLAILGIVIAMVSNFLGFSTNVFSKSEVKSEIQNQVNAAAYSISNTLRNVKGISIEATDEIGFSIFNIRSKFPQLDEVDYDIIERNGTYSLHYTVTMKGYTVESQIILNNIESVIGDYNNEDVNEVIWILTTEDAEDIPTLSVGSGDAILRQGVGGKVTYYVKTTNIPNDEKLTVSFIDSTIGMNITENPKVKDNKAAIEVTVNEYVPAGNYEFEVTYPGAVKQKGVIYVLDKINMYLVTFNKNGGDTEADPSTIEVLEGDTVELPLSPSKSGYAFKGWNTKADGSGTIFDDTITVEDNMTVYAQWELLSNRKPVGKIISESSTFVEIEFDMILDPNSFALYNKCDFEPISYIINNNNLKLYFNEGISNNSDMWFKISGNQTLEVKYKLHYQNSQHCFLLSVVS